MAEQQNEKQDALDFLKSIIKNIESIISLDDNLESVKQVICKAFSKSYTEQYDHYFIFKDLSDEEFVSFLKENISDLKTDTKTVTEYTIWI